MAAVHRLGFVGGKRMGPPTKAHLWCYPLEKKSVGKLTKCRIVWRTKNPAARDSSKPHINLPPLDRSYPEFPKRRRLFISAFLTNLVWADWPELF